MNRSSTFPTISENQSGNSGELVEQFTFHARCNKYFSSNTYSWSHEAIYCRRNKRGQLTRRKNEFSPQQLLLPERTAPGVEYFSEAHASALNKFSISRTLLFHTAPFVSYTESANKKRTCRDVYLFRIFVCTNLFN